MVVWEIFNGIGKMRLPKNHNRSSLTTPLASRKVFAEMLLRQSGQSLVDEQAYGLQ
jgi:hypothetical protein